jgi:hypothetical protein
MNRLTLEDLQIRRQYALACAERAVIEERAAYRELKALVLTINSSTLDISEYHATASRLGRLLEEIDRGAETIFAHFRDQIDPRKSGKAVHFRFECRDLAEQIADLEKWRAENHGLRRVK